MTIKIELLVGHFVANELLYRMADLLRKHGFSSIVYEHSWTELPAGIEFEIPSERSFSTVKFYCTKNQYTVTNFFSNSVDSELVDLLRASLPASIATFDSHESGSCILKFHRPLVIAN